MKDVKAMWEMVEDGDVTMAWREGRGVRLMDMHLHATMMPTAIERVFPPENWEYR